MPAPGERGSACSEACGYCGACTNGRAPLGECKRCGGALYYHESLISKLCDPCLDADHQMARIANEHKRQGRT